MSTQPSSPDLLFFASDFPPGKVLFETTDPESGLRLLVARGPFSFCSYIGVKADHALASLEEFEFDCHFGVNFREWGREGTPWEQGWFWWGWDYAHFTDRMDIEGSLPADAPQEVRESAARMQQLLEEMPFHGQRTRDRTLGEVIEDGFDALMEVKAALAQSEKFAALAMNH